MNNLEKAKDNLEEKDIWSVIENETLYVLINDVKLELSIDEIYFQAKEYDDALVESDYPYDDGDMYWVIQELDECRGKFHGITAINGVWDDSIKYIFDKVKDDEKQYFSSLEDVYNIARGKYNFIKIFPLTGKPFIMVYISETDLFINPNDIKF